MNSISTDKSDSLDTNESLPGKNLGDFRLLKTSSSPSLLGNRDLQPWAKQRRLVFKKTGYCHNFHKNVLSPTIPEWADILFKNLCLTILAPHDILPINE